MAEITESKVKDYLGNLLYNLNITTLNGNVITNFVNYNEGIICHGIMNNMKLMPKIISMYKSKGLFEFYRNDSSSASNKVCIKIIRDKKNNLSQTRHIIMNHIKAMKANLAVPIYSIYFDLSKSSFTSFIVMKKMKITLREYLNNNSIAKRNNKITETVCLVKSLNKIGIVHNDVHFSNLMLDENNKLLLIDFDASRSIKGSFDIIKFI